MDNIKIEGTSKTPTVEFDRESGVLEIRGRSIPENSIDFYKPVYPNELVKVISEIIYFRFNKLKCKVRMVNENGEVVALGEISGMIVEKK